MAVWRMTVNLEFGGGGPGANVFEWRDAVTANNLPPVETADAAVAQIQGVYNDWRQVISPDCTVSFDGVFNEISAENPRTFTRPGFSTAGTASGSAAPQELCLMASLRTSIAARYARGRKFVGPLAQSAIQSNGTPEEVARGHVQDGIDRLVAFNAQTGNGAFVIYSRVKDTSYDIIGGSCPNHFGVLRSRRNPG